MVIVIDGRLLARSLLDGRGHAAFELVVIVAVEEIVLAVVLIVDDGFDRLEAGLESFPACASLVPSSISIGAPKEIGSGKVGSLVPKLLVNQDLEACAIGARLGAEDSLTRNTRRFARTHAPG